LKKFGVILVGLLIPGCFVAEAGCRHRASPRGRVADLRDFLRWRPACDQLYAVDVAGEPHVIAYGPPGRTFLLASGPAAYVFAPDGKLVDWSPDMGDDPAFDDKWAAQRWRGRGRRLSRGEAAEWPATQPAR
jgi:hypothetical protein